MTHTIITGNEEFDIQLGGGIPAPSLVLIEGEHGTGKSAVTAQILSGVLEENRALCITESTVKDYIDKMKSITFDFSQAFMESQLSILPLHVYGKRWTEKNARHLLPVMTECINNSFGRCECVIIDSLSLLTLYSDKNRILDFFGRCKHLVGNGMTIIITIRPQDIPEEIRDSIKGSADVYLKLNSTSIGTKNVKTMDVVKMVGAQGKPESNFAFDVDMNFGIKIVPISMASA